MAPQPIKFLLEVQVSSLAESPESSAPAVLPETPSPVLPSPPPQSVGDAPHFVRFISEDYLNNWGQWAVDARGLRGTPGLRLEQPEFSTNLKTFLNFTLCP